MQDFYLCYFVDAYRKFCLSEWQNGKKTPSYADAKAEETLKELAKKKQV